MELILQTLLVLLIPICAAISVKRTGALANPVTLLSIAFFLPMLAATFRLSGLQSATWDYNTYAALIISIGSWLVIPTIAILCFHKQHQLDAPKYLRELTVTHRLFAGVVFSAYIYANIMQAGTPIPIINPEIAFAIHHEFPEGIRLLARCTPAVGVLAYLSFYHSRKKLDLLILAFAIAIPLTRLSRIDPAITLIALTCLYPIAPIFSPSRRNICFIAFAAVATLVAASELGTQRQNRFGEYEFKYAEMIKWEPETVGPGEILPVLYGYTSLSFENLDATISMHNGRFTYALYSFDWLYSGFLKLNWFTPYGLAQYENYQRESISSAATVPTALIPFYKDFGPLGLAIPALMYMAALLMLYFKSNSTVMAALYGLYSGAFGLASFQALIAASPIIQQMAWIVAIFAIAKMASPRRAQPTHVLRK